MSVTPLDRFIRASDAIFQFVSLFNKIREEEHTVFTLELHGDELKISWDQVKLTYEKCLDYLNGLEDTKADEIDATNSKYRATFNSYVSCLGSIKGKIHDFQLSMRSIRESPTLDRNCDDNLGHNLSLPPCDVDIFEGDYLSWPTFRDLFTALYINCSRLSNIERLFHLIRKTDGEAREIVSKCPLTNLGFETAWSNLKRMYDNPRMLVNNQLKSLFGLPFIDTETSTNLKSLQRGINSCLSAMAMYDIPTNGWDPIIVFMCIQRLPSSTVSLWEQSVKDKFAHSLWKDLDHFLTERIQTLDCLFSLKGSELSSKSTDSEYSVHATSTKKSCILCPDQYHFLRVCQRFQSLTVTDRISTVSRNNYCYNCLSGSHQVSSCRSNHNCLICGDRHHTLLHQDSSVINNQSSCEGYRPSSISGNQLPSTSTGITSNQRVFHTRQNKSVLLGTATVNLVHNSNRYQVRALIDSASECSFVSDHLRNRLKLPTHSSNANILGVNGNVSAVSKKVCSLTIGSNVCSSIVLNTMAFVLPKISEDLASFSINTDIRDKLPNLNLADSNPFDSRPIDILIGADLYPQIILPEIQKDVLGSLLAQKTIFGWILTGPVDPTQLESNFTRVNTWNSQPELPLCNFISSQSHF